MIRCLFLLLLSLTFGVNSAQEIVNRKPLIQALISDSASVDDIWVSKLLKQPLAINDIPFLKGNGIVGQKLIRTKNGLFVLPDGTGRVYEIKRNGEVLSVHRIDSTIFFGYNFDAFAFVYRDTIYSYGGYGIWRFNGQLRVYLPHKHEWELVPLSREIPFHSNSSNGLKTWFDQEMGQLYVNKMPDKSKSVDSIYKLDMKSKKWTTVGKKIIPIDNLEGQINTSWGVLCKGKGEYTNYILLDLKKNRILQLSEKKSQEIVNHEQWNSNFYFKDSTLFIVADSIYKVPLRITDFEVTQQKIYEEAKQATVLSSTRAFLSSSWKVVMGMAICLVVGFMGATYAQKAKNRNGFSKGSTSKTAITIFDEKEKELIRLIFENSRQRKSTSIENINKILGLSFKPNDLQKKHRSDTISSINQKFQYLTKTNGSLLRKSRSEIDKRSFEYYINYEDYKSVENDF